SIYHTGTSMLDFSANGRRSVRSGNRSLYLHAAPHGVYRCADDPVWRNLASEDRWIAIACLTEDHWRALVEVVGDAARAHEARFATLAARYAHQDALDACLEAWTRGQERYELMARLQARGVPAGAVQDGLDRIEQDPQLAHLGFIRTLDHSEVGPHWVQGFP